jgi:hypothetical protein
VSTATTESASAGAAPADVSDESRVREFAMPASGRQWKTAWLIAYEDKGTVTAACKAARISRQTAYVARREDPVFAEAWEEAQNRVVELLEETATEKALAGDGRMIEFMLKANRPGKYREHSGGATEAATEEIEQGVNDLIEKQGSEIERLTERLADVAPGGEAQAPRDPAVRPLATSS